MSKIIRRKGCYELRGGIKKYGNYFFYKLHQWFLEFLSYVEFSQRIKKLRRKERTNKLTTNVKLAGTWRGTDGIQEQIDRDNYN
jgi:hypothetical protein